MQFDTDFLRLLSIPPSVREKVSAVGKLPYQLEYSLKKKIIFPVENKYLAGAYQDYPQLKTSCFQDVFKANI